MTGGPDVTVPGWAVTLRETVARIDERTKAIPDISAQLENLRKTTVPLSEHELLMHRVNELWDRDLGARADWAEMTTRVPILWEERGQRAGERRGYRIVFVVLTGAVTLLTGIQLLHGLGLSISVHP
jgi:hypothetical protein